MTESHFFRIEGRWEALARMRRVILSPSDEDGRRISASSDGAARCDRMAERFSRWRT